MVANGILAQIRGGGSFELSLDNAAIGSASFWDMLAKELGGALIEGGVEDRARIDIVKQQVKELAEKMRVAAERKDMVDPGIFTPIAQEINKVIEGEQ